ncbi:MAG: DUF5050 domain-containing protein [Clostridia bacterium]|nr:DUF5050 domain-containing protein [Clostridia bacterium]
MPDYREGYANVLGNNTVNLSYFEASFIAEQDGWLYFFTESNRLMKQNMETGHTTPIYQAPTGDSIRALNAVGDWLYFVNENKGIMRMRTDSSGLEQLSSLSVGWMLVRGEELFYRHNSNLYVMDIPTRKASVVEHSVSSVYVCEKVVYYDKRVSASDFDLYQWTKEKGSELVSANAYYFLANGDTTVYYRTSKGLVARGQDGQERLYPWKQLEVLNGSIWEYGDRLVALERPGEIQQMSLSDGVFSNIVYIAQYSNVQPSYAAGLESGLYWRQDGVVYRCRRGALSFHNYEVFWRS